MIYQWYIKGKDDEGFFERALLRALSAAGLDKSGGTGVPSWDEGLR
jgi:hypothetical protein